MSLGWRANQLFFAIESAANAFQIQCRVIWIPCVTFCTIFSLPLCIDLERNKYHRRRLSRLLQFICHARNVYVIPLDLIYLDHWVKRPSLEVKFFSCLNCISLFTIFYQEKTVRRLLPQVRERLCIYPSACVPRVTWTLTTIVRLALRDQGFFSLVEPRGLDTGKPLGRQNWVTLRLWPTLLT